MTDKKLTQLIGNLKVEPNKDWLMKSRRLVLSEVENVTASSWQKVFYRLIPANFVFKPVAVYALVLGLFLISSFATVNASKNTLPGSPLYLVKTSAEKVKYFLTFSPESKAKVSLELAQKRVGEFKELMTKDDGAQNQADSKKVSQQIVAELDNIKENLNNIKVNNDESDNNKLAVVQFIDANMASIKQDLTPATTTATDDVKEVLAKTDDVKTMVLAVLNELDQSQKNMDLVDGKSNGANSTSTEKTMEPVVRNNSTTTSTTSPEEWKLEREKVPAPEVKEFEVQVLK